MTSIPASIAAFERQVSKRTGSGRVERNGGAPGNQYAIPVDASVTVPAVPAANPYNAPTLPPAREGLPVDRDSLMPRITIPIPQPSRLTLMGEAFFNRPRVQQAARDIAYVAFKAMGVGLETVQALSGVAHAWHDEVHSRLAGVQAVSGDESIINAFAANVRDTAAVGTSSMSLRNRLRDPRILIGAALIGAPLVDAAVDFSDRARTQHTLFDDNVDRTKRAVEEQARLLKP